MAPPLIQLKDIALTFGGTPLLSAVELSVSAQERVCLIGRNGSGKSTLLKIAAGLVEPDRGSRFVQPGATIRYLPQEPDFAGFASTLAYVEAGLGPGDDHYPARYVLEQLGLRGDEDPAHLSGGEARRAALARVLAPSPDILLLDEPTNHLDLTTIEWLESELDGRRSALVIISHDRRFLSNLSRETAWLDRGKIRQIDRGFAGFEAWRDEVFAEEEREQHKLDRKIVNEEHWLRYGVSAAASATSSGSAICTRSGSSGVIIAVPPATPTSRPPKRINPANWSSRQKISAEVMATARSSTTSRSAFSAATASASSAPTAPARPR